MATAPGVDAGQISSEAAAVEYAAQFGWHLFPCCPKTKRPLIQHGLHAASTNPETIRGWWQKFPHAMIGCATGEVSGFDVLDVDMDPSKGIDGDASLAKLANGSGLPATASSRTPRGGKHLLFRHHPGLRNSASKVGPGLDIRADGGYVILPPSINANGRAYSWLTENVVLYPWPEALLPQARPNGQSTASATGSTRTGRASAYGAKALEDECRNVATASVGTRNATLNKSAFNLAQLVAGGELDEPTVRRRLQGAATSCGLDEAEIGPTIDSGFSAGLGSPRTAPEPKQRGVSGTDEHQQQQEGKQQRKGKSTLIYAGVDRPYVPPPELVRDTFPEVGVAFIGGQSGALKTFFAVHASTCLMTGIPLAGRKIERQGGIVYIAAEGEATIEGRLKADRSRLQTPSAPLPFYRIPGICPLAGEAAFAELTERLREAQQASLTTHGRPLVACIIDTVIAAGMIAEDKENDPVAWQQGVFDPLQKISIDLHLLFLLVHHFGKSPAAGLRGSSNSRAGADAIVALTCDRDELTGKTSNHFLALSKSRSAPEGPIGAIGYEQVQIGERLDGSPVTSLVLNINTVNKSRVTRKESRAERAFREALAAALKDTGVRVKEHGQDDGREVTAVPVSDVRDQFEKRYVTTGEDDRKRRDLIRKQFKIAVDRAVVGQTVCAATWDGTEWLWK